MRRSTSEANSWGWPISRSLTKHQRKTGLLSKSLPPIRSDVLLALILWLCLGLLALPAKQGNAILSNEQATVVWGRSPSNEEHAVVVSSSGFLFEDITALSHLIQH